MKKFSIIVAFGMIVIVALFFRLTGINWDNNQYLNPDERFLVMVVAAMKWPTSFSEYLSTATSPLNPHNIGHQFYVYGTWPLILIKFLGDITGLQQYGNLHLVGRFSSAFTDIITLIFVMLTTYRLSLRHKTLHNNRMYTSLLSGFIYATMVIPIQLSHFFTVDPYVVCMITILLFVLTFPPSLLIGISAGLLFALSLSAKLSAAPLGIIICIYSIYYLTNKSSDNKNIRLLLFGLFFVISFICLFRVFMPYLFANGIFFLNPKVIANIQQLQQFNSPDAWFPPSVQWIHTNSLLYPLKQLLIWGIGVPFSILFILGIITAIKKRIPLNILLLPLSLILITFFYQGIQYAMPLRYFWTLFPPFAIIVGLTLPFFLLKETKHPSQRLKTHIISIKRLVVIGLLFLSYVWSLFFLSIYLHPHTRITASEWIYNSIPPGSTLSHEHWDDPLPLNLTPEQNNGIYNSEEIEMYYPDTLEKWNIISEKLSTVDYLILSSNRVYGSLSSAPEKFPLSAQFYQALFEEKTGFVPVKQFVSRPSLSIPGISLCLNIPSFTYGRVDQTLFSCEKNTISIVDDYAEESFTVYDHPKVIIFQKTSDYSPEKLMKLLSKE
jgi:hypothetical protein